MGGLVLPAPCVESTELTNQGRQGPENTETCSRSRAAVRSANQRSLRQGAGHPRSPSNGEAVLVRGGGGGCRRTNHCSQLTPAANPQRALSAAPPAALRSPVGGGALLLRQRRPCSQVPGAAGIDWQIWRAPAVRTMRARRGRRSCISPTAATY